MAQEAVLRPGLCVVFRLEALEKGGPLNGTPGPPRKGRAKPRLPIPVASRPDFASAKM